MPTLRRTCARALAHDPQTPVHAWDFQAERYRPVEGVGRGAPAVIFTAAVCEKGLGNISRNADNPDVSSGEDMLRFAAPDKSATGLSAHWTVLLAVWLMVASSVGSGGSAKPGEPSAPGDDTGGAPSLEADQIETEAERISDSPPRTVSAKEHITPIIDRTAKKYGVEPTLVHAVIAAESAYHPTAVSRAGAIGLMQVMPATAADYDVTDPSSLFDPQTNVETGVRHLKRLLRKYGEDYGRVIMAYNAGEDVVDRTDGAVTYTETLDYAEAVILQYRKRGGSRPLEEAMSRVAMLRRKKGAAGPRHARTQKDDPWILPKTGPGLENRLLSAPPGTASLRADASNPAGSPNQRRSEVVGSAIRPGVDPAIRLGRPLGSSPK